MMTPRHGTDDPISSWLVQEAPEGAPPRLVVSSRERIRATPQRRTWWPRLTAQSRGIATFWLAAAAVIVVAAVGVGLSSAGGRLGGGGPAVAPSPTPTTSPTAAITPRPTPTASPTPTVASAPIPGLPVAGATPSAPDPGELVLEFFTTHSNTHLWVYADGRIIWTGVGRTPGSMGPSYIGFSQQRLTPAGVEFLLSPVRATGMFTSDLMLAREGTYTPFYQGRLRDGSHLVTVTWAWRGIAGDAPVATAAQERALMALEAELFDPASWPASSWEDPVMRDYVPEQYVVCFGILHGDSTATVPPVDILAVLPAPARVPLRDHIQQDGMHSDYGCAQMTTDDTIAFALALDDARIPRDHPRAVHPDWVRYQLRDSASKAVIMIQFGPVLPHGEGIYLGPG